MGCYVVLKAKKIDVLDDILLEVDINALFSLYEKGMNRSEIIGIFDCPQTAHYIALGELLRSVSNELGFNPNSEVHRRNRGIEKARLALNRIVSGLEFLREAQFDFNESGNTMGDESVVLSIEDIECDVASLTELLASLRNESE